MRRQFMERVGLLLFALVCVQLPQPHSHGHDGLEPNQLLESAYNPKFTESGYGICDLHNDVPVVQSSLITIYSPRISNDSNLYPPNVNCSVLIRATEPGALFQIKFSHLHIEKPDDQSCVRDSLRRMLRQRLHPERRPTRHRLGRTLARTFRLIFRSDSQIEKTGFKVTLSQYLPVHCISGEQNLEATTDSIVSIDRPNADRVSLCYVNITSSSPRRMLLLDFESFRLDYSGASCVYDRLEIIHAIGNETFNDYGCGYRTPFYYHINSDSASIAFRTDSKSTSRFRIRYTDLKREEWEYRKRIDEFTLEDDKPVTIDLSQVAPNYVTEIDSAFYNHSTYIFKFETAYARKINATLSFCYRNLILAYSDRLMASPTPRDLLEHNFMNEPNTTGLTCLDPVEFDRLSPQMMVFVFSLYSRVLDPLVLTVQASRMRDRMGNDSSEVGDSPMIADSRIATYKNFSFIYSFKSLQEKMHAIQPRQRSVQLTVPLYIKSAEWKSDVYFNFTRFGLYTDPPDPSCRMSGFIIILTDADGQEQVVPDGVVLSFNINRYKCDHVNFWNQKQEIINADCVMLQSPVKKCIESVSNHSVTFVTPEPYLVFSLFTNRFLTALMLLNETQSLPGPLSMFDKANCSSTLNFVRQQINGSYLVTVSYTSTCPFSPDHWSIHLEQKCRTRVPHNEIKNVNSDSEQIVQHECGFLETPNYPFAYQNYEEPLVWIFDPLQSRNESESLSHYYEFSLDVFTLDVCLNSKLLMSESINGSFSKETTLCGYKKGEKFSTISSRRLLLMFLASKISQTSSSYQGFSISFKLKQDASRMKFEPCSEPGWISFNNSCYAYKRPSAPVSWDEASMECSRLGGHLVSIQSQDEMNAIKQMLLYEWHSEAFAHP
uniref:CUB domain-containing protein n=1 Tax=Macrostomum lignano TaxID=282301 RepID=A0A1I8HWR9_9PLAT